MTAAIPVKKQQTTIGELLKGPPLCDQRFSAWERALQQFTASIAGLDSDAHRQLTQLCNYLRFPQAIVAFGGHFKSGKSTLLNSASGRAVLPVDDLPETGALCFLRSGPRDHAVVFDRAGNQRSIACNTAAIQQEVSLIASDGTRREKVHQVDRLEITLSDCTIPPGTRWIDSPGINDTDEMTRRARRGAHMADSLVWVLSSSQALSETEMDFLAEYTQSRGPASLIFVLNVFLKRDALDQWQEFLKRNWPVLLTKVRERAPHLGFTDRMPPVVLPVSGRALPQFRTVDFGGGYLAAALSALSNAEHPRVRRARLGRCVSHLRRVMERFRQEFVAEQARLAGQREEAQAAERAAGQRQSAFRRDADEAWRDFLSSWGHEARKHGNEIAASISADNLRRDDFYSTELTERFRQVAAELRQKLIEDVNQAAYRRQLQRLYPHACDQLAELLSPPAAWVHVPKTEPDYAAVKWAAIAGGVGGLILGPWGAAGGAGAGAALAAAAADKKAAEQDALSARESARGAGARAASAFADKQGEIISFFVRHCAVTASICEPDETMLLQWQNLLRHLTALTEEAWQLANGG